MPKPEKPEKKDKRPRKSLEYWKRRAEARMYEEMEKAEGSADTVSRVYAMAARYLMDKADQVFDRYQTTEKLSEAEAVQMLNSMNNIEDMNELERKLTEDGSEEAMRSLERLKNTGAYGSRIGRLGELLKQVNDLMSNIYKQDVKETRGILSEIASDSYLKTMYDHQQRIGIGFSVAHLDKKRVDKVLNMNWSGKHFSERLWGNTQKLGQRVKEEMVVGALTGKTEREMAEDISKEFGRGNMEARRLIRTESCYVASEVNAEAYEDADIEKYLFLATLDLRTSPVCRELDGKRFHVKDRQPGVNCPPMHPWCRSTTIAIVDEEYLKDMTRSMRDPDTGQTEQVPLSMTYKDWYEEYVEGNAIAEADEKKLKNKAADKKQYQKYKEVLGEEAPKSLEELQELKYTDEEKWNQMKHTYRIANMYESNSEKKMPASKIVQLHENMMQAKRDFNAKARSGNTGVMEMDGKMFISNSKLIGSDQAMWENFKGDKEQLVGAPVNPKFNPFFVETHVRKTDSEYKLFEFASDYAEKGEAKKIYMLSEFPMCDSCKSVKNEFIEKYPDVDVYVVSKKDKKVKNENEE